MPARKFLILALVVLLAVPPFAGVNTYWLHILNLTWIAAIAALGLNLATGMTGQIVLGQAALMGVGAYTAGLLMVKLHWPWIAALPAALAVAAAIGVGLGLLSMRIKGHYLAITTLALNEIFRQVVLNEADVTGGPMGLRDIPVFRLPFFPGDVDRQAYLPLLALMLAALAAAVVL
jgi:branched-chain amino acid transport system permease protein